MSSERRQSEGGREGGRRGVGQSRRIISHSYSEGAFYTTVPFSQAKSRVMVEGIHFTKHEQHSLLNTGASF